jgi:hypothetical protein
MPIIVICGTSRGDIMPDGPVLIWPGMTKASMTSENTHRMMPDMAFARFMAPPRVHIPRMFAKAIHLPMKEVL